MLATRIRSFSKTAASMFKPLFDRILVERLAVEGKTTGGILIPEALKGKHNEATVIAVGEGRREEDGTITPLNIKVGDRVLLGLWSGNEVKFDGREYIILREEDVLGIIE